MGRENENRACRNRQSGVPVTCIKCQIGERYAPGVWTRGVFQPARPAAGEPLPPKVEGELCPVCGGTNDAVEPGATKGKEGLFQ